MTFGCMSELYYCPSGNHTVEYDPMDFHRKVTCGDPCCDYSQKQFGFCEDHVAD